MTEAPPPPPPLATSFTHYQKFVAGCLVFLQFAVILDFMIISPLGAIIMPALNVSPQQFGLVVSAYAFSAGLSALLAAGFADRFDRKRMLLFFYTGFVIGTLWCALADSFPALLMARVVTGLFGGVIGAVVLAIATDLSIVMVLTLTHLGPEPLPIVILVNVLMFVGIISRMVPLQALVSSIPEPTKRGSFNAVNSAVQQFAGGVASIVAGNIVIVGADGRLLNVPAIGYVVVGTTLVSLILAWRIHQSIRERSRPAAVAAYVS